MRTSLSSAFTHALFPAACFSFLCACTTTVAPDPVSSSLTHLALETRPHESGMLDYSEILAINGLFPVSEVGATYRLASADVTTAAVGMARDHSFRFIGVNDPRENDLATQEDVLTARDRLLELQRLTARAIRLTFSRDQAADFHATDARIEEQLAEVDRQINRVRRDIQDLTHKGGLIIARWSGDPADPSRELAPGDDPRSGFVVLGQLRVAFLFVGDDFKQLVGMRPQSEELVFKETGFTTYVLQAKHVAYAGNMALDGDLGMPISELHEMLGEVAALATDEYLAGLSQFSNMGNIGTMRWTKEPYCFVAGDDLVFHPRDGVTWNTVVSQVAHGDSFPRSVLRAYRYEYRKGHIPPESSGRMPCTRSRCSEYPQIGRGVRTVEGPLPAADSENGDV